MYVVVGVGGDQQQQQRLWGGGDGDEEFANVATDVFFFLAFPPASR